ncbi:hypothetical protein N183_05695 [Sinorhizobium sp. Sb3]|nr:hypothetical protein N183_05695 [Sinorhizobium sp. Sb3]
MGRVPKAFQAWADVPGMATLQGLLRRHPADRVMRMDAELQRR